VNSKIKTLEAALGKKGVIVETEVEITEELNN
jgi:hypothetical protein